MQALDSLWGYDSGSDHFKGDLFQGAVTGDLLDGLGKIRIIALITCGDHIGVLANRQSVERSSVIHGAAVPGKAIVGDRRAAAGDRIAGGAETGVDVGVLMTL